MTDHGITLIGYRSSRNSHSAKTHSGKGFISSVRY